MTDVIVKRIGVFLERGTINIEIIEKFEEDFSIRFPLPYKNLLAKYNQLYPEKNCFSYNVNNKVDERDVVFLGYGEGASESVEKSQEYDVYGHDGVITFGESANGDHICFDYRQNPTTDNPPVVLMYHDQYVNDKHGQPKMAIVKIADDFDSFIDMLHE